IQLCRDPKGYVPIGSNPWRGPPVPYGTPVEDPRMTLPMNKFPFIPPQVDPDPGPPVVQLPPGVAPGPGPAPQAPFPLPVEAPAAWSHHPPEGQGDGPAMATYDQNGKFVDPAGGTGVFAAGADKLAPAETWVDLMLAPRQA